jgi:transcription elongation GreA/GreB family factor
MPVDKLDESRGKMRIQLPLRQTKTAILAFTKVFAPVKKSSLRDAILLQLRQELARQAHAAEMSRAEAISEESRAENKWDTHSQEAAYLAEAQAKLAGEIGQSIDLYATVPLPDFASDDAVALGAVVELEGGNGTSAWFFIGPRAGGLELETEGRHLLVLTPQSPLGRQLIGKRAGEVVQSAGRGAPATQRILSVR